MSEHGQAVDIPRLQRNLRFAEHFVLMEHVVTNVVGLRFDANSLLFRYAATAAVSSGITGMAAA